MIRILIFTLAGILVHSFAESGPFSTSVPSSGPRIKISTLADRTHPGGRFKLYLSVEIEEGWHIYSLHPLDGNELLATKIILEDNVFESTGPWQESPPSLIQDDAQEKLVRGHTTNAEFHKSFRVPKKIDTGSYPISGKLLYRACDNNLCTLPQSLPFGSQVHIGTAR